MTTPRGDGLRPGRAQTLSTLAIGGLVVCLVFIATQGFVLAALACGAALLTLALVVMGGYRVGVLALMAAFAVAPAYRGIVPALSEGITPADLLLVAAIFLMVPVLLQNRLLLPPTYVVGAGIVIGVGLVSAVLSAVPMQNLALLVNWILMLVGLPVVFALWRPSGREVTALLWSYIAGHMVSVGVGLAEGPLSNDRFEGLTHHPNAFGAAGAMAFALGLFLFHRLRGNVRARSLVLLCQGLSVLSIVLSGSRAALVVAAVLVLLVPIVERSAVQGFALALAGGLALMALTFVAPYASEGSAISRLQGNETTTGSDEIRTDSRDYGIDRFLEDPVLGSGLQGVDYIHDLNLAVLVAVGVLGFVGYAAVMFTFARPLFGGGQCRRLSYAAWCYLGIAPTVPSLWDRTMWLPLALSVVAVLEASHRREGQGDGAQRQVSRGLA